VGLIRKLIILEQESSPLLIVNESLTEEIYNDIINQSKNPPEFRNDDENRINVNKSIIRSADISHFYNSSSKDSVSFDNGNYQNKR